MMTVVLLGLRGPQKRHRRSAKRLAPRSDSVLTRFASPRGENYRPGPGRPRRLLPTRFALLWLLLSAALPVPAQETFRFSVFGLFHPTELLVRPAAEGALLLQAGPETVAIEGARHVRLRLDRGDVECDIGSRIIHAPSVSVTGRGAPADFRLEVPGKIGRRFRGTLDVSADGSSLIAAVRMHLGTATASIVAAESAPGASLDALRVQAVATRSYLLAAKGRHGGFNFCDTTHCQYLRAPPPPEHPAWRAVASTRDLVLMHDGAVVPVLYSRSCGGRTHSLEEVGLAWQGYPYFSVVCGPCLRSPEKWERLLALSDTRLLLDRSGSEAARLQMTRRLGWNAVPSNRYHVRRQGDLIQLRGRGIGHGVGLCQRGARAMAVEGTGFQQILQHYLPDTILSSARAGRRE